MSDSRHQTKSGGTPSGFTLKLDGIGKRYGSNTVLSGISYEFEAGVVYGVLGENGAGKSTLMKILSGLETPTAGTLSISGRPVVLRSPADALRQGISIITQEQTLMPHRTVLENVYLGRFPQRGGFAQTIEARHRYQKLAKETGSDIPQSALVRDLQLAQRQQVEIMRAIDSGSSLVIMDEPTAILDDHERERLLDLIHGLASRGIAVVLISHYLDEVLDVCDEVIVLRNGMMELAATSKNCTAQALVTAMSGSETQSAVPEPVHGLAGPVALSVKSLSRGKDFHDVTFDVRAGEIVGLTGLVGSGASQVLATVYGYLRADAGAVRVHGCDGFLPQSIRQMIGKGVGYIPQDRRRDGLFLGRSLSFNISSVSATRSSGLLAWWNGQGARQLAKSQILRFHIRSESVDQPVGQLSGGNQQKTLFAKTLAAAPSVLLVDEPTRGVDIKAKGEIHAALRALADKGAAVCIASTDIDEIRDLSDRIAVFCDGTIRAQHTAGTATREELLQESFGANGNKMGKN